MGKPTYHLGIALTKTQRILGWLYLPFFLALTPWIIEFVARAMSMPLSNLGLNIVYFSCNFAFVLLVFHRWLLKSLRGFTEKFWLFVQTLILGFALHHLGGLLLDYLFLLFAEIPVNLNDEMVVSLISQSRIVMLLCTIVVAPIVEETLVRGIVFGSFYKINRYLAYAVSILLFSFIHIWQYADRLSVGTLVMDALSYIPAGIALGWTYEKSGTIFCPIVLHALINAVAFGALQIL